MSVEELEAAALRLTSEERARLAERLLASLDDDEGDDPDEVEREWEAEILRRMAAIDAGTMKLIPVEEVIASARELIQQQTNVTDGDASPTAGHDRTPNTANEPPTAREPQRQGPITQMVQRVEDEIDNRVADRRLRAPRNRTPNPWEQVKNRLEP